MRAFNHRLPGQGRSQGRGEEGVRPPPVFFGGGPGAKATAEATKTLTEVTKSVRKPTKSTSGQSGLL